MHHTKSNPFHIMILALLIATTSCNNKVLAPTIDESSSDQILVDHTTMGDETIITVSQEHNNPRMRYKVVSSAYTDKADVWSLIESQLGNFKDSDYRRLHDYIYEQDIPKIQRNISESLLTYEQLSKWYLYRILIHESNPKTTLHSIISIMPDVITKAKYCDQIESTDKHPIFGMPVLLKDNINAFGQPTTAGAIALANNKTYNDAKIVENLNDKGAIILGKANLSEWAYYFCDGCPLGYSAVGGQTLNPYGRTIFETGGSSAASGTSMAANYAAAAVGTETAGSILSPSSQNSIVGLKPTIGLLSRSGIVPISSTLDTPGPMTRSVIDNAILLSAMYGEDKEDSVTLGIDRQQKLDEIVPLQNINKIVLGANASYMESEPIYKATVEKLKAKGVTIVEFTPKEISLEGFLDVLNHDMQRDLPEYLTKYAAPNQPVSSVSSVIDYNLQDSTLRSPYGQGRLIASRDDTTSPKEMDEIKARLEKDTRVFFDYQFDKLRLDAILSINNYDAATAAMAKYPCLAMPMGYTPEGEPKAMTFIGKQFEEAKLLSIGQWFESEIFKRTAPEGY